MIPNYEKELRHLFYNPKLCANCKGRCCQRSACNCSPLDFDNDINKMRIALYSGNYAIDFARKTADSFVHNGKFLTLDIEHIISTDNEALYIRARNQNRPIVDIIHEENKHEGPCVLWSYEKGCSLSYKKRPMFGRTVIPNSNPSLCFNYYQILGEFDEELCSSWKPFNRELFKLAQELFDENWHWYQFLDINLKEKSIG